MTLRLALLILMAASAAQAAEPSWTVERHGDAVYGHDGHGGTFTETEHNGVITHDGVDGHWTVERHGDTVYVHPK